jgi:quinol monooxygenase YgiN
MSLPVLIGFAGVLVAAVATGMLAGRCARQPRIDFILWTAATLALAVALAAQSIGFARGFNPATFRAVQLFALLLAPLWLGWGLAELAWPSEAARFGTRLICGALTVVGGVILATDPLSGVPFGKSWPLAGVHYQPVSHYVLDVVQAVAVIVTLVSVGLAAGRARNDRPWPGALTGIGSVGLAVLMIVGLRFSLPARSLYPLLSMTAAALVWFGATRIQDRPGRGGRNRGASGASDRHVPEARYAPNGHYGPGAPEDLRQFRDTPGLGDPRWPGVPVAPNDHGTLYRPGAPYGPGTPYGPGAPYGPGVAHGPGEPRGGPRGPAGSRTSLTGGGSPPPGTDPRLRQRTPPAATSAAGALAGADSGAQAGPTGSPAAAPPRPYGRILIFTLLEDRVADFDRLAEQAAEEVRTGEPDTLVYVIHLVPNAPMQRIFYEIYRDRAAFDSHESQPYIQRFATERRSCVLATNVIELRLKYAKVAPLASSAGKGPAASPGARPQLPPGQPAGAPGVPRPQVLEPLPPGPDRRLPSAGRRYGGI